MERDDKSDNCEIKLSDGEQKITSPYWHLDLANYFPSERYFNSVVYIHKKYLAPVGNKDKNVKEKLNDKEKKQKKVKKTKVDKCQQFASDFIKTEIPVYQDSGIHPGLNNDVNNSVFEQTLQFAKNIVPIVLPPTKDQCPVYYTIKAARKSKKQTKPDHSERTHDITYKKEKSRRVETCRTARIAKESLSVKETISYSSRDDTLNEIHLDQSLCCSFSDASDQKLQKKHKKEKRDSQKIAVSESFEALATEYCNNGDTKIKVHLMNDMDKSILAENIKIPILNAIRDCIKEINSSERNEVITTVHSYVKCNTQRLDTLMEKVTCVERKMDEYFIKAKEPSNPKLTSPSVPLPPLTVTEVNRKEISPKEVTPAPSALERLESDNILEVNFTSEGEEEFMQSIDLSPGKRVRPKTAVRPNVDVIDRQFEKKDESKSEIGGGETKLSAGMGARPNRIPARYCWTGVARKP